MGIPGMQISPHIPADRQFLLKNTERLSDVRTILSTLWRDGKLDNEEYYALMQYAISIYVETLLDKYVVWVFDRMFESVWQDRIANELLKTYRKSEE